MVCRAPTLELVTKTQVAIYSSLHKLSLFQGPQVAVLKYFLAFDRKREAGELQP